MDRPKGTPSLWQVGELLRWQAHLEAENAKLTDRLAVVTAENETWQAQARRIADGKDPDWEREPLADEVERISRQLNENVTPKEPHKHTDLRYAHLWDNADG